MRTFGLTMLVVGFLWIVWDAGSGFVGAQYTMWVWHSKQLPPGDLVTRQQASAALRDLSIALKDRHRVIAVPALVMLAGGILASLNNIRKDDSTNSG